MTKVLSVVSAAAALLGIVIALVGIKSVTFFGVTIFAEGGGTVAWIVIMQFVCLGTSAVLAVKAFRAAPAVASAAVAAAAPAATPATENPQA